MVFVPNPDFEKEMAKDDAYRAGLTEAAAGARDAAERNAEQIGAPWMRRAGAPQTVVLTEDEEGPVLVNTDHAGHLMEWGSVNNPPHAPLRRGVEEAGLRLRESP